MALSSDLVAKIRAELLRMEEDCIHSGKSHFNACARWTKWNYLFGIPSVILSALAGTAFFKDYSIVAGIMAAFVTVLTALMTFLKPAERASNHKNAGDQYLSLRNDTRVFRDIEITQFEDDESAIVGMSGLTKRRNELNQASPQFANKDFQKARTGIDKGEALHAVDQGTT